MTTWKSHRALEVACAHSRIIDLARQRKLVGKFVECIGGDFSDEKCKKGDIDIVLDGGELPRGFRRVPMVLVVQQCNDVIVHFQKISSLNLNL